jgi:2-keto-3-deoxy-L-rhamnonate aldolase RhmA
MGNETLSGMLAGIANGSAKSLVRVGGFSDRPGIQQALDMGSDGVLIPYINNAGEARQAVSCARYPTAEGKKLKCGRSEHRRWSKCN